MASDELASVQYPSGLIAHSPVLTFSQHVQYHELLQNSLQSHIEGIQFWSKLHKSLRNL
ncbi:unknown [Salmonella phage FelixO1]|uniref:Uncharacterized protein n=1 Tax=Salmonella phage Felix O1 (isolate Felix O1-VT1) TaxID=1283336 RepID=Q6KG84_BPFO1|nr:unknown [Salmonella phage FelixO1]